MENIVVFLHCSISVSVKHECDLILVFVFFFRIEDII